MRSGTETQHEIHYCGRLTVANINEGRSTTWLDEAGSAKAQGHLATLRFVPTKTPSLCTTSFRPLFGQIWGTMLCMNRASSMIAAMLPY